MVPNFPCFINQAVPTTTQYNQQSGMNFSLWFTGLSIWTQDLNKQTSECKQIVTSVSISLHSVPWQKKKKKKGIPLCGQNSKWKHENIRQCRKFYTADYISHSCVGYNYCFFSIASYVLKWMLFVLLHMGSSGKFSSWHFLLTNCPKPMNLSLASHNSNLLLWKIEELINSRETAGV